MDKPIHPSDLLAAARQMNEDLAKCGYIDLEILRSARVLGRRIYQTQPHWHSFKGECTNDLPFEIYMQALSLLTSAWVADIYLRKARDRKSPAMEKRYEEYEEFLLYSLKYTWDEVHLNRDKDAERDFQRWQRPPTLRSRIRCWLKRLWWGH